MWSASELSRPRPFRPLFGRRPPRAPTVQIFASQSVNMLLSCFFRGSNALPRVLSISPTSVPAITVAVRRPRGHPQQSVRQGARTGRRTAASGLARPAGRNDHGLRVRAIKASRPAILMPRSNPNSTRGERAPRVPRLEQLLSVLFGTGVLMHVCRFPRHAAQETSATRLVLQLRSRGTQELCMLSTVASAAVALFWTGCDIGI